MSAARLFTEDPLGALTEIGTFTSLEAAATVVEDAEDAGTWPSGFNAVAIDSEGQRWLYTDDWEKVASECPDCGESPCHPQCLSGGGLR